MTVPGPAAVPVPEAGRDLAARLARAGSDPVRAVLMYGSHLLRANPDRHSAHDFVVIVDDYGAFYRTLKASGEIHRPASMFTALSAVLPPNVIAFTPDDGREGMAKCLVVRSDHFEGALGPRPRDHFLLGRMIQKVALAWSRTEEDTAWVEAVIRRAHDGVLDWMAPYLEGDFDAAELGARILEVCYRGEIRPEAGNRSQVVFETQRAHFEGALAPVMERAAAGGRLVSSGPGRYRLAEPPSIGARLYWRWHFLRSKARTTSRWVKHVLTFDNWLPYIVRKVERRTGMAVELTRLERRWPLIFLWPRVVRVLRARPDTEDPS